MPRTTTEMIRKLNSFILVDFHIHIDTISIVLPILYLKASQVLCILIMLYFCPGFKVLKTGAQWLRGRVLDLRQRGHGFEPHWCHCVVSMSMTH